MADEKIPSNEEVMTQADASLERARALLLAYPGDMHAGDIVVLTAFCLKLYSCVYGVDLETCGQRMLAVAEHLIEDEETAARIRAASAWKGDRG